MPSTVDPPALLFKYIAESSQRGQSWDDPSNSEEGNGIKVMKCPPSGGAVMLQLISLARSDGEQLFVSAAS